MRKSGAGVTLGAIGILVVVVLLVAASAFTPVRYGTVKVVKRFGGLTGRVFEPGLHWKTPFVEGTVTIVTAVRSYETSDQPKDSNADYRDYPVNAQTIDGQQVTIKFTTMFKVPAEGAVTVLQDVGDMNAIVENVVKAHSRNAARLYAQEYTAEELYGGEGIFAYQQEVEENLQIAFEKYGVLLDDFLVRKVEFDADYITTIEQQQIAQEQIETARYNAEAAEYEKQKQIRQAEADAQRQKLNAEAMAYQTTVQAQADADKQMLLADAQAYEVETVARAEAQALRMKGQQLTTYPALVQWETARNLSNTIWGILPDDVILPLMPTIMSLAEESGE
jgi:membrane protease subunit HflC